jgi:carboxypeptidase family protein
MRRIVALSLASSLFGSAALAAAGAPRAQAEPASLSGTASSSAGQTLANVTVQLRDVVTGQLAGTTTSSATGAFSFAGLQAGTYTVEVVSATGQIVGTSAAISVTAGATVTGVAVSATAAAVAGGAAAAGAAAGAAASTGISTAVIITTVAAAAGVAGAVAVATNGNASPSR